MDQEIVRQLKRLRSIAPDPAFVRRSRSVIFAMQPERASAAPSVRWNFALAWAGALAAITLAITASLSFLSPAPALLSSALNAQSLNNELNDLTISVQLKEITYQQTANQTIASAIKEISDTQTRHLSVPLLESELEAIETSNATDEGRINELLDRVIF